MKHHVQYSRWLAHIYENEQHAHSARSNSQKLTQYRQSPKRLVVMQIVRQHYHHCGGSYTDQKSELCNVEPPGHVPAQAGNGKPFSHLEEISQKTDEHCQAEESD